MEAVRMDDKTFNELACALARAVMRSYKAERNTEIKDYLYLFIIELAMLRIR